MSFRELKEEVYLVLQIKGGHGFGFATYPLVITANLAGNIHESFVTEPCPQPKFENEFVWVMDKTKMKGIWADKIPVRLECLTINQSRRSRVGYTILNVKDAQIIQDESKITEKQVRLLGLSREVSLMKPELILAFFITDIPIQKPQLNPQFSPRLEGKPLRMTDGVPKVTLGSKKEHFKLCIDVVGTTNIKELLPSHSDIEPDLLTYKYSLLGAEIISDVTTSQGVQLSISSSLSCLKTYFIQNPSATVSLHVDSLLVGHTDINLEKVLLSEELHLRRNKHLAKSSTFQCTIVPSHDTLSDLKPCLEFSVSFSHENPLVKKKPEMPPISLISSVGAGGDADNSQSVLSMQPPMIPSLVLQGQRADSGRETYRTQCPVSSHTVTLTVTAMTLDQPLTTHSWLRLSQACASVSPQQHEVLEGHRWVPVQWHLSLSLPRRLLESTLTTQPASLQLGSGDHLIAAALLHPPHNIGPDTKQNVSVAALESGDVKVGEVQVSWSLGESSSHSQTANTLTDTSVSPPTHSHSGAGDVLSPRSRELKIHSFVEELEDWAEKQRILVMEGLKEEEAAHLAALRAQWEAEVGGQVTEGRQLVEALHSMRDQLREQESQLRENELKLKVYKDELERVHRSKLQEFKDLSRRMQDEFNHKLGLIASDKVSLEQKLEEVRTENTELKQTLRDVENASVADKRRIDSLTHDLNVLKEKLTMEQESKKFFKEHCRKAEQEIHRLNCLRQQDLEARLQTEKKSLEQLAFQQLIVERNDLRQDQQLLDEIRQQLITGHSNNNGETVYLDGQQHYADDRHIRRAM